MKRIPLLAILLFWVNAVALAQNSAANFGKQWALGGGTTYKVDFQGVNATTSLQDSSRYLYLAHGHSNICDSAGNLVLLCDGMNLYNATCDTIEDGGRLVDSAWYDDYFGWSNSAQSSIILPFPNGKYYLVNMSVSIHYTFIQYLIMLTN